MYNFSRIPNYNETICFIIYPRFKTPIHFVIFSPIHFVISENIIFWLSPRYNHYQNKWMIILTMPSLYWAYENHWTPITYFFLYCMFSPYLIPKYYFINWVVRFIWISGILLASVYMTISYETCTLIINLWISLFKVNLFKSFACYLAIE